MKTVYVEYDMSSKHWQYYYYDDKNFKTSTAGFENHIRAKHHAIDVLGIDIEFIYK
jgi:hypothetical protein